MLIGELVTDEEAVRLAAEALAIRHSYKVAGLTKHFAGKVCVRCYGPLQVVFDLEGNPTQAKNGHPLGTGQRWNRPARLNVFLCKRFSNLTFGTLSCLCIACTAVPSHVICAASLLVKCTEEYLLCLGKKEDG